MKCNYPASSNVPHQEQFAGHSKQATRFSATLRYTIPLLITLLLSACGFHLRGISNVPSWLNNVAIISVNNDKQFISILESRLESAKVQVNSDPSSAKYWLIINEVNLQQQIVSVGASTNPRQYTLTLTVLFEVKTRAGQVIEVPGQISISRELTMNNDRILGSKDEESILIGEMKQDAVTQIIYRLGHLPPPPPDKKR
ncbi:LPS assembly lipoprotein LptE [Fluoribacter dumoffii]|uniref:LPS-assembly lipoprotein LptE n=1 Tax=Fluoribacter dumoffii TaxID=463 RepID=A0A377G8Q5_9GAMM|nr:LPS assembly lipoprotein LptE [Fluoribacter dumoffii]KTC90054.1 Rare lipoprotein B [Fluoribacter dumoffii NY 23]MCW8385353.1 LPS assembly lipoprotein LptE [Fluoribacter dumoffii]MCW8418406.1 LPS assembly lipoprotein LptE [Fluoribacter dumoffii]MCW8453752.1 LPS assembly lipoprotein LptE [Fluoribacter dumoffii]MCW8462177.1 LPS assembly lipoprotein LptE [Fluoribacter dumoffii]